MVCLHFFSKVVSILAEDPRFRAVEKDREREELFEDYIIDLEAKVCYVKILLHIKDQKY